MDLGRGADQFALDESVALGSYSAPVPFGSAGFLAGALRHAGVGTWQVDMPSGLFTWDAVTGELLGVPAMHSAPANRLPIHPDDRAAVWQRLRRQVVGDGTERIDFRIILPTGDVRWMRAIGRQRDPVPGYNRAVAGVVMD